MKKLIFCFSLVCTGLIMSCIDKNEEVDESSKPSWLGGTIYSELSNPSVGQLKGSFKTYLRLIDDLGYAETLNRTGSKTVFPANDEAFERFFEGGNNPYGVTSYEQLTESQKKQLLYSSMLDNALLTSLLSNANDGQNGLSRGVAIKHATNLNVIDTVAHVFMPSALYLNNPYWREFDSKGIYTVNDATTPMMVHFTRDYMISNSITTTGEGSDFSKLVGQPYDGTSTYIFGNKVIVPDVTCQNGYIHQVEDVVTQPGNMAQVIKTNPDFSLFSRMLDRFAVPVYNAQVTSDYQDWALQNGRPAPDSIYEVRYASTNSQGVAFTHNDRYSDNERLPFDPGWNAYAENATSTTMDASVLGIAAMFVPDDEALKSYFLNGSGKSIIEENAVVENNEANLRQNIDSIPLNLVAPLLSNLMKASFANTVPSKFSTVTNDVGDIMGLSESDLRQTADGTYDISIANNGVIYRLNNMLPPVSLSAVSAPARIKNNMKVANWAITNRSDNSVLTISLDYYAYLQAMKAKFALFLPTDQAFDFYYIDPASLGHTGSTTPLAYHYYYSNLRPNLGVSTFQWDPETNSIVNPNDSTPIITPSASFAATSDVTSIVTAQLTDILNYHTIVLNSDDNRMTEIGGNKFYKTKHGGEIMVTGTGRGAQVLSGAQINNGYAASNIEQVFPQDNGNTYQIDRIIQGPVESVYKVMKENAGADGNPDGEEYESDKFSEFFTLCDMVSNTDLLEWAGINTSTSSTTGINESDQYRVFSSEESRCLDQNVSFFNTYNYTVYVPNNDAMRIAYANGLPEREKIENWYEYHQEDQWAMDSVRKSLGVIADFIRYHFQRISLYADQTVYTSQYNNEFSTFLADDLGISLKLNVTGGGNKLNVVDAAGVAHVVDASSSSMMSNRMARDFLLNAPLTTATYFTTSSFAVIHELSEPLYYRADKRFDKAYGE